MEKFMKLWKKYSFMLLLGFFAPGMVDMRFALAAGICMVAPVLVSIKRGRFWCGNMCPRGNFYDRILQKVSKKKSVPKFLKSYAFRSIVVIIMMSMFAIGIYSNWGNLYGIGMVFYRMIFVTTVVGIGMSFVYNHRTWCHFCPMGTLSSFASQKTGKKKLLEVSDSCVSCKLCKPKCSLGIVPYDYKDGVLNHPDCIQCKECVVTCPKDAIGYEKTA